MRERLIYKGRTLIERMITFISPTIDTLQFSRWNFFGLVRRLFFRRMKNSNLLSVRDLLEEAKDLEIKLQLCDITMKTTAITKKELIDYPYIEFSGATRMVNEAIDSEVNYYI